MPTSHQRGFFRFGSILRPLSKSYTWFFRSNAFYVGLGGGTHIALVFGCEAITPTKTKEIL